MPMKKIAPRPSRYTTSDIQKKNILRFMQRVFFFAWMQMIVCKMRVLYVNRLSGLDFMECSVAVKPNCF